MEEDTIHILKKPSVRDVLGLPEDGIKTLKDIKEKLEDNIQDSYDRDEYPIPSDCIDNFEERLKEEAIKHVINNNSVEPMPKFKVPTGGKLKLPKRVNELDFEGEKIELSDKELIKSMKVLNGWIKYFFNITEEDLK